MKTIILSVALIFGSLTFVNAQTVTEDSTTVKQEDPVVMIQASEEWKEVSIETLGEKVQAAIKAYEAEYEVKLIMYNEASKQAKVTFAGKEDATEKVVIFNEEGEEIK